MRFGTKLYQQINGISMGANRGRSPTLYCRSICFITEETLCCPFLKQIRPILSKHSIQRLDTWTTFLVLVINILHRSLGCINRVDTLVSTGLIHFIQKNYI